MLLLLLLLLLLCLDAVNEVVKQNPKALGHAKKCITLNVKLLGAHNYTENLFIQLVQAHGLDTSVAKHLAHTYGDRAWEVAKLTAQTSKRWPIAGRCVVEGYPYLLAEVKYATAVEYARTAVDVLARRTRLAFLNVEAARKALPVVVQIMGDELGWGERRREREVEVAMEYLETFPGPEPIKEGAGIRAATISDLRHLFDRIDLDNSGFLDKHEVRALSRELGFELTDEQVEEAMAEV